MIYIRPRIDGELKEAKIIQKFSKKKIILSSITGVLLHVTIDAFHHPNIQPFIIEGIRPFFGLLTTFQVRGLTFGMLLACFPIYIAHVRNRINLNPE
jgi:membrane-bound metal-dependent hydrolase YbcI (DUF457 family)